MYLFPGPRKLRRGVPPSRTSSAGRSWLPRPALPGPSCTASTRLLRCWASSRMCAPEAGCRALQCMGCQGAGAAWTCLSMSGLTPWTQGRNHQHQCALMLSLCELASSGPPVMLLLELLYSMVMPADNQASGPCRA